MKSIEIEEPAKEVLLVEDNPGDIRLMREAFRETNASIRLHVAYDGAEAIAFLKRKPPHTDAPRPGIILLDLRLPKMDGQDVLAHIKQDESLRSIPTVIVSASESEADISKSYQLHANCYLTKSTQLDAVESLVMSINDFWLKRAKLPRRAPSA
jgi:CheY-like chemotaxis protein